MPLSPPQRRHALHTPGNHSLTNADQIVTKVDTKLTKVDTVNPRTNPKPQQNTAKPQILPRCQPLWRTPNNPEQIRTNPNTAVAHPQRLTPHLTGGRDRIVEKGEGEAGSWRQCEQALGGVLADEIVYSYSCCDGWSGLAVGRDCDVNFLRDIAQEAVHQVQPQRIDACRER